MIGMRVLRRGRIDPMSFSVFRLTPWLANALYYGKDGAFGLPRPFIAPGLPKSCPATVRDLQRKRRTGFGKTFDQMGLISL